MTDHLMSGDVSFDVVHFMSGDVLFDGVSFDVW